MFFSRHFRFWFAGTLALLAAASFTGSIRADLVTPPSLDYFNYPSTAIVGQAIGISAGAHANYSDNSDGNDWNSGTRATILRIWIQYYAPDGSSGTINDWMPSFVNPNSGSWSFTPSMAGSYTFSITLMDGRPWYSGPYNYSMTVQTAQPGITSSTAAVNLAQNQGYSYQISGSNNPTSYNATGLPPSFSINQSNGVISGSSTSPGSYNVTYYASNGNGTGSASTTWTIVAASISNNSSVSAGSLTYGSGLVLYPSGSANFGIAWTENVIFTPSSGGIALGNQYGGNALNPISYTPSNGPGTYIYLVRLVDNYSNFVDHSTAFTVSPALQSVGISPVGTSVTAGQYASFSASGGQNGYVWGGSSGAAGNNSTNNVGFPNVGTYSVTVYSPAGGNYAQSNTANVTVTVNPAGQNVSISPTGMTINAGQAISFTASGGQNGYGWGGTSGAGGNGTTNSVTFSSPGTYTVTVYSPSGGNYSQSNTATATVTVNPLGQNVAITPASASVNVGQSQTFSGNGGNNGYIWGGVGTGTGVSTTVFFPNAGTFNVSAYSPAGGTYGQSNTAIAPITVSKATPIGSFSTRTRTAAASGVYAFSGGDLNATFANPYSGSATAPAGGISYTISGNGIQAGTQETPGTYNVQAAIASDANYNAASVTTTFTILPTAPTVTSGSTMTAVVGQVSSYQVTAASNPTSFGFAWINPPASSPAPFNSSTGLFQITPSSGTAGSYLFAVNASNAGGTGPNQNVALTIYDVPSITSSLSVNGAQNIVFNYQITATGSPNSFNATGLPPGLSIAASTGVISGNPTTPGTYSPTISASNLGATGSANLTINIATTYSLSLSASPVAGGNVGGAGIYVAGTSANITASPNPNYRFAGWSGPAVGSVANPNLASTTVSIIYNASLVANFVAQATLTVNGAPGGTVSGSGTYDVGTNIGINAIPNANYAFVGWGGSGVANASAASTTVNLTAPTTVTANFLAISVGPSATITFSDAVSQGLSGAAATTSTRSANIANTGVSALTITSLATTGDFAPTVALPLTVPPGSSTDIVVKFAPAAVGTRKAAFTVVNNDTPNTPILFSLQGNGTNPNATPVVTISAAATAYTGSPFSVSSGATVAYGSLTNHDIEALSPSGSWTIFPGTASGSFDSKTIGITFGTSGTWTLRAGASTDSGATWTYSPSINITVSDGLSNVTVRTMAVPDPGTEVWYTPSSVAEKVFTVQRKNP